MRCTANTKPPETKSVRCERELGHPGLHRIINERQQVIEFPDSSCWFPRYNYEPDVQPKGE